MSKLRLIQLEKLEQSIYLEGCDTCRTWTGFVIVDCDADGDEVNRSRPDRCPVCGRDVDVTDEMHLIGVTLAEIA